MLCVSVGVLYRVRGCLVCELRVLARGIVLHGVHRGVR